MKNSVKQEVEKIMKDYGLTCSVDEFRYKALWNLISERHRLSEDFIREFKNDVRWYYISRCQKLSMEFIHEHRSLVHWTQICEYQKLSMAFIRRHKNNVLWSYISVNQELSESFIREFKDRLNIPDVFLNQKLSDLLMVELRGSFDCDEYCFAIKCQKASFKEKSDRQKLKEIKAYARKHGLEFDGEYLYAFREHDQWGRGAWNRTIFYDEVGKEYRDWRCDMDQMDTASFGLGIWPKKENVNTKVKVHYKDWGCEVEDGGGKGRVWAFTLLGPMD